MPNWMYNRLTITGPEDECERFMRECFTHSPEGPQLDFDKISPQPDAIKTSLRQNEQLIASMVAASEGKNGGLAFNPWSPSQNKFECPDWYEWRCLHWGTKWNACDTVVVRKTEKIEVGFDTAWSKPAPIYEKLFTRFPNLRFEGTWFEEGFQSSGNFVFADGDLNINDTSE